MKNKLISIIVPFLLVVAMLPLPAQEAVPAPSPELETGESEFNETDFGQIAAFSHTVSSTTGIAMSPLLGMGVLGAWKYYKSDDSYKNSLPWYSNPWIWGICFAVFLLLKSKDTLGAWIPEVAKKPITVLDDLADKASALIVALAVIPAAVWDDFESYAPQSATEAPVAMAPFILPVLVVIASIIIFTVVWVAFNALSSIKILSPFAIVNFIISIFKGVVITVFAGLAFLNPWVGLVISLLVILVCALIFGWAFRWNVFGTLYVKDFFTEASKKPLEDGEDLKGFSTGNFPELKPRTYGRVTREGDELVFSWKPWLIMPTQTSRINLQGSETSCRNGVFFPTITLKDNDDRHRGIIDFRLRYRSHGDKLQSLLGLDSVKPGLVVSGAKAGWLWLKDQIQKGGTTLVKAIEGGDSVSV